MEELESEYPTDEQVRELFEARKKPGAIAKILRRREQEMKTAEDKPEDDRADSPHAGGAVEAANPVQKGR